MRLRLPPRPPEEDVGEEIEMKSLVFFLLDEESIVDLGGANVSDVVRGGWRSRFKHWDGRGSEGFVLVSV
jgi:hypothetical protein